MRRLGQVRAGARGHAAHRRREARQGARQLRCQKTCTVIVPTPLHSNYEGFLLSVPVFDQLANDPDLAPVKRVTLTLNDNHSGQVFSITCAASDLKGATTPTSLQKQCHSIYL